MVSVAGALGTNEAQAKPAWISCQAPVVCYTTDGKTCTGCAAGPQIGLCSTYWLPLMWRGRTGPLQRHRFGYRPALQVLAQRLLNAWEGIFPPHPDGCGRNNHFNLR